MKRNKLRIRPTRVDDLGFDSFYEDSSENWEQRARTMHARRWRAMRRGERPA